MEQVSFQIAPLGAAIGGVCFGEVLNIQRRRLDDVLVVEKGFGVPDGAEFGLIDVVLLADIVVPVDPFGEETVRAAVVFGDGPEYRQAVEFVLAAPLGGRITGIGRRLEPGQRGLGVFPQAGRVPALLQVQQPFGGRCLRQDA